MTSATQLPFPGALWGRYPERRGAKRVMARQPFAARRYAAFAERTARLDFAGLRDPALAARVAVVRQALARGGLADDAIAHSFALFSEFAWRELGLRAHPVQVFAARAMLDERLAEMATGDGKTLAAALAASSAALARVPVHVITVNDYLARRDALALQRVYARLGLKTGIVTQEMDADERRVAYACDITYCTAKELVFDYLRDAMRRGLDAGVMPAAARQRASGGTVLRGLCMAIIDEADSVLLDEARVPFVLSRVRREDASREHYARAFALARALVVDEDVTLDREQRSAELSATGRRKVDATRAAGDALWQVARYREEAVSLALAALHVYHRDVDYLVRGGRVQLIEPTTGRVAPGRAWSRGLHQLIELKEGCAPSPSLETAQQITYQRFFARYVRLCGMSGTLAEGARELARVYGLRVVAVPLRSPSRRVVLPQRVFTTAAARWRYVAQRSRELSAAGRPVLIGTDSVSDSQALSTVLQATGLPHVVLNARQDNAEAEIVAGAGRAGRVTVATSMAGRGTDIAIDTDVAARGGLHVILCQANASARIDRQFLGRCARRGEPGSCETLHCAESDPIAVRLPQALVSLLSRREELRPRPLARLLVRLALRLERRRHDEMRRELWRREEEMNDTPILGAANQ